MDSFRRPPAPDRKGLAASDCELLRRPEPYPPHSPVARELPPAPSGYSDSRLQGESSIQSSVKQDDRSLSHGTTRLDCERSHARDAGVWLPGPASFDVPRPGAL